MTAWISRRSSRRHLLDVLVIGAGQAGLAMGRELERAGYEHMIIDAAKTVGSAWLNRWDSLTFFTPAAYSGLRGIPFPAAPEHLPTRLEAADYLNNYARAFSMPIALDEPVRALRLLDDTFHVQTDYTTYRALNVVVATGGYQAAKVPAFASMLPPSVTQLHSSTYRNPSQLPAGPVLVVGAGNSGVQLAREISATHDVTLATGSPLIRLPDRLFGKSIFSWLEATGAMDVTVTSRLGRKFSRREMLVGESAAHIARTHGVRVIPRITRVEGSALRASDDTLVQPKTVLWATGYKPSYDWLHLPVFQHNGKPQHARGITQVPGLYFLGLPWQHTRGSSLLGWVPRDAEFLGQQIQNRAKERAWAA
jgi:putative flavoprotein involved in K+ transport